MIYIYRSQLNMRRKGLPTYIITMMVVVICGYGLMTLKTYLSRSRRWFASCRKDLHNRVSVSLEMMRPHNVQLSLFSTTLKYFLV